MTRCSTKRIRLWLGVGALTAPAAVLAAAHTSAALPQANCHYVGTGPGVQCDYGIGAYVFNMPTGITSVDVIVTGGSGGNGAPDPGGHAPGGAGGAGAVVTTTYIGTAPLAI